MKKIAIVFTLLTLFACSSKDDTTQIQPSQIFYTTTDGKIIQPVPLAFECSITSNVYKYEEKGIITFDGKITKIGYGAFERCKPLSSIKIPESVITIEHGAFSECHKLESFDIPNGITSIEGYTFNECHSLKSVNIPESVTKIGGFAFKGCTSLESINIPINTTLIYGGSFWECKSLKSIKIPKNVTRIGDMAFVGCSSLISVYCEPTTPPILENFSESGVFIGNRAMKIYVPENYVDAYKSADGWKDYADKIVGYDFSNE